MINRTLVNAHYGKLIQTAEMVLRGPSAVQTSIDFWGEPNLTLRNEAMPKVERTIVSRIVYANPCDSEQNEAILRHASWDAHTARQALWQDFAVDQASSMPCPVLAVYYVWIDIDWLYEAIKDLERLVVPIKVPKTDSLFSKMYRLGIRRSDRTGIEIAWGKNTPGLFSNLDSAWESLWKQMTELLRSGRIAAPEESWPFASAPSYRQEQLDPS